MVSKLGDLYHTCSSHAS